MQKNKAQTATRRAKAFLYTCTPSARPNRCSKAGCSSERRLRRSVAINIAIFSQRRRRERR